MSDSVVPDSLQDRLAQAPFHVRLAIDLIMQLEVNEIDERDALAALEIVKVDLEKKLAAKDQES